MQKTLRLKLTIFAFTGCIAGEEEGAASADYEEEQELENADADGGSVARGHD